MARILISYGTTDGHTAKIAEYIADVISERGHQADAVNIKHPADRLVNGYDAVIVGGSVHAGKHENYVLNFVRKNLDALQQVPSALFSVSMAAVDDVESAVRQVEKFEDEAGWHPATVAMFGGALLYAQYGFLKRRLMRKIVRDKGGKDLDLTRDYVYTEWDGVKKFAEDFLDGMVHADAERASA